MQRKKYFVNFIVLKFVLITAQRCQNIRVLKTDYLTANTELVSSITQCKQLQELVLIHCSGLKDQHISEILRTCPIKHLDISGCDDIEGQFLRDNHQIKSVYLDGCSKLNIKDFDGKKLTIEKVSCDKNTSINVKYIIFNCKESLQTLILRKSGVIDFQKLCQFDKLENLKIQTSKFKDFNGFEQFTNQAQQLTTFCIDTCK